ncbi:PilZ domain-containing protein [Spongiibacter sp.]|uniref:PilZ domain-containing protein n=1 Tax=Spongiibacter sp. TaxID=2024860 RepID=UPI0035628C1B
MTEQDPPKRRYFRVPYPEKAQPPFHATSGQRYAVLDISEKGLKINAINDPALPVSARLSGIIELHGGKRISAEGVVLRQDPDGVAVALDNSLDVGQLFREQTYIRKHYPVFLLQKTSKTPQR